MSGTKSKNKGKSYERDLAKYFTELFGGSFTRVPYSGAYIGRSNNVRMEYLSETQIRSFKGDLIPSDEMKHMVVEAKFYADFPYHALTANKQIPILDEWISQALDAVEEGDVWFLCVKINRRGQFVVFHKNLLNENIVLQNYSVYYDYIVADLTTFFYNNKEQLQELCK